MKKNKLFIGISGKMGTGKSTITNALLKALPNGTRVSMSSPIYKAQDMLYKEYGIELEGDKDRDLLIAIGLWGRGKHPDFWLNQAVKSAIESEHEIIICDDVRFENEANFFSKYGTLFRIEGEQRGDNVDTSKSTDATETALDDYKFDHVIQNNLPPEEICKEIARVLMAGK